VVPGGLQRHGVARRVSRSPGRVLRREPQSRSRPAGGEGALKLVLSRKGMDSAHGGMPSPILPDGRLCPLPIPDPAAPVAYADLRSAGIRLGQAVADLSRGRIPPDTRAHLDPDLARGTRPRPEGFVPLFGQCGAAQGHLERAGVGPGDLFLFFGWFRAARFEAGRLRFVPGARDLHVIFGWLQVERVVVVGEDDLDGVAGASLHPHLSGCRRGRNLLYVGARRLRLPGAVASGLPGAGLLSRLHGARVLTAPGAACRGDWRVPGWLCPPGEAPRLSHHAARWRWRRTPAGMRLRSVGRGQEFVHAPVGAGARRWVARTLSAATDASHVATLRATTGMGGPPCTPTSNRS